MELNVLQRIFPTFSFLVLVTVIVELPIYIDIHIYIGKTLLCLISYIYIYISQQSILKQGFQKTHFPTVLEVENFFAVDLANF